MFLAITLTGQSLFWISPTSDIFFCLTFDSEWTAVFILFYDFLKLERKCYIRFQLQWNIKREHVPHWDSRHFGTPGQRTCKESTFSWVPYTAFLALSKPRPTLPASSDSRSNFVPVRHLSLWTMTHKSACTKQPLAWTTKFTVTNKWYDPFVIETSPN